MGNEDREIQVDGVRVPLRIIKEWRKSTRFSIAVDKVILRIPILFSRSMVSQQIDMANLWLEKQFKKSPELKSRFNSKTYKSGDIIEFPDRKYILSIEFENRKTSVVKTTKGIIHIKLPLNIENSRISELTSRMISKGVSIDFIDEIKQRVHLINSQYFNEQIKDVRLKYNKSNWGSCSSSGRINISTRCLFAPVEVLDYVIIHELAHLKEMNHSQRFWQIVKTIDPDYKAKEYWLKTHGHLCRF